MDPVQRLLAIAERERRTRALAPVGRTANREPPAASLEDTARRHQRLQQALVSAVRAGREPDPDAREELVWFARLGMSEADALAYLLRKYPAAGADNGAA
jgi:hypothetical protein